MRKVAAFRNEEFAEAQSYGDAELKLVAEVENAAVDGGAGEMRIPRSLEFYEQFITTISARFHQIDA
jgi:hypothetical protein